MGTAHVDGRADEALEQIGYVNNWTVEQCEFHSERAILEFERRSRLQSALDLAVLASYGIKEVVLNAYDFDPLPQIEGVGCSGSSHLRGLLQRCITLCRAPAGVRPSQADAPF
jgi:hypothetical protein